MNKNSPLSPLEISGIGSQNLEVYILVKLMCTRLPISRKIWKPWGYEVYLISSTHDLKIIYMEKGKRTGLHMHTKVAHQSTLILGRCEIILENGLGELDTIEMERKKVYPVSPKQKHRIQAITDCVLIEFSEHDTGMLCRFEDDWNRTHEQQI